MAHGCQAGTALFCVTRFCFCVSRFCVLRFACQCDFLHYLTAGVQRAVLTKRLAQGVFQSDQRNLFRKNADRRQQVLGTLPHCSARASLCRILTLGIMLSSDERASAMLSSDITSRIGCITSLSLTSAKPATSVPGTDIACVAIRLCACYAMPGTDIPFQAMLDLTQQSPAAQ
eukprot:453576-Rhodomonas_salina.1